MNNEKKERLRYEGILSTDIDKKDIDTTEGGEATAEPLRSESKAGSLSSLNLSQKNAVMKLIEHAMIMAGLSFEQERAFRMAFRAEYARLVLGGGK